MSNRIEVVSVNISEKKGTPKHPVDAIFIDEQGVVEDAHRGPWHRQVSLLSKESVDAFSARSKRAFQYGEFAENITLEGIDLSKVALLDRFRIGRVELEVTQIGKKCHGDGCAIFREVGQCIMPKEGLFCKVTVGGRVKPGQAVEYIETPLPILVVTLSDRASRGEYSDRAGLRVRELLENFFSNKHWHQKIETVIIPDDAEQLEKILRQTIQAGTKMVVTTGGTGIGPRDITPDVVLKISDMQIPGIMESIRVKYGMSNPNALLSRAVAAVASKTIIYAIPGSLKAVEEYMVEILKTFEHASFMLHGFDTH